MRIRQKYRMRTPSTGREVIVEAVPDEKYVDRDSGEELEVIAQLLPLAPTPSELSLAVENLRFCNWCDQLSQKELTDCPVCGGRMQPVASDEQKGRVCEISRGPAGAWRLCRCACCWHRRWCS